MNDFYDTRTASQRRFDRYVRNTLRAVMYGCLFALAYLALSPL